VKQNKKAVVTGGAGFIDSHLADELATRGYHVVILDDLSTGKIENVASLLNSSPFSTGSPLPGREVRLVLSKAKGTKVRLKTTR